MVGKVSGRRTLKDTNQSEERFSLQSLAEEIAARSLKKRSERGRGASGTSDKNSRAVDGYLRCEGRE